MKPFGDFVDGYYDVKDQLPHYLLKKAEVYFNKEELEKCRIKTIKDFERRRDKIKKLFLDAIGGLPLTKTTLNPVITGKIHKEKYTIEKIIFESQPNFFVTSNLYIPKNLIKKVPGILFVCGHDEAAKASPQYQKICIDLANNGFVVLAIDPPGQGERMQYYNPKTKKTDVRWGTREHIYAGLQCIVGGSSIARYFIWDGIRGIDYLISRDEVDGNKIGGTGNSGGGTQTAYLMMVEDRIKCAIPCSYITSRYEYMKTGQAHDAEQNIFGAIKNGINYDDFITAIAPKPVQIGANAYDFFCIEGTIKSYKRAKKIYSLYNSPQNLRLVISQTTHAYTDKLRQEAVNWFKYHLKGEKMDFTTNPDIKIEKIQDLNCTSNGQILDKFQNSTTVFTLNQNFVSKNTPKRKAYKNHKSLDKHIEETRKKLIKLLGYKSSSKGPFPPSAGNGIFLRNDIIYPRSLDEETTRNFKLERLFFFTEPDIVVTAYFIKPLKVKKLTKPYILLLENGTNDAKKHISLIKSIILKGNSVLVFDPRGVGGVCSRPVNPPYDSKAYYSEFKLNYDAIMMGTSLLSMRVFDIIRAFDYLQTRNDVDKKEIGIIGFGIPPAIWALFASILQPKIKNIILHNMLFSYKDIVETKLFNYDNRLLLHGILKQFDIVDLIPCFKDRNLKLINLRDSRGKLLDDKKLNEKFLKTLSTYYPSFKVKIGTDTI